MPPVNCSSSQSIIDRRLPRSFVPPRVDVLGVGVHALTLKRAVRSIEAAFEAEQKGYVCVTGVHGVMEAQRDPHFRRVLNDSLLTTPDGMPTVWVGRLQGRREMSRVFGPDLMRVVCSRSVAKGCTHFLYGGREGVAEELKAWMEKQFPGIQVVGTYTPSFGPLTVQEIAGLQAKIAATKPDIMWIGLSTPKQERFMAEHIDRLETKLMIGVGAAFDYHTGRVHDAPAWMKRSGLQWLHRLAQDPKRLWKRYLINNPLFISKIGLQFGRMIIGSRGVQ
jgi:N-acetylglucosaminyldiphosphoundecaprenol N-acetyl-beta-D-mannosaminyltransferase